MRFAPYYSYSPIVMEMTDYGCTKKSSSTSTSNCDNYDYAVPEGNTLPLLPACDQATLPMSRSRPQHRVSLRSTRSEGAQERRKVLTLCVNQSVPFLKPEKLPTLTHTF